MNEMIGEEVRVNERIGEEVRVNESYQMIHKL